MDCDVLVIGGGPTGATTALSLARRGFRVIILEKDEFPRFHIGESFLPRNTRIIRELGLEERLKALPHMAKHGAEFCFGQDPVPREFRFDSGFECGDSSAWNIERAPYDAMILDAARDAGTVVKTRVGVKKILKMTDGDVAVLADDGKEYRAKWLVDASGQGTVVGRHLSTRKVLPQLKKVAYFGHFHGVFRYADHRAGYPTVVMCKEGWFWMIPIDEVRTSIGMVLDADAAKEVGAKEGVSPNQMLAWGISRCPVLKERTKDATFPAQNGVTADFSYRCEPYAGPGYFLVGDAATFVDPIFSTGVCLGMASGVQVAEGIEGIERRGANADAVRRKYCKYVKGSSSVFFRLVYAYYTHPFRELFMHGQGPFEIQRAIISILAGHVFPKPSFKLRWRHRLFEFFVWVQGKKKIVPARETWSLLTAPGEGKGSPEVVVRTGAAVGAA